MSQPNLENRDPVENQPKQSTSLGRGLDSLLGPPVKGIPTLERTNGLTTLPLNSLKPGPYQPRSNFNKEKLTELSDSISERGVLQPILVRPSGEVDKFDNPQYEIIAGERRWRASLQANLKTIPVIIKHMTDKQALESGLIENIQRHDLNPLEEALGYDRLKNEFNYTQEQLSKVLGKSRSYITNSMRLLTLPESVKELVEMSALSVGHARALVNCPIADEFAILILKDSLSVRQTERLINDYNEKPGATSKFSAYFDQPEQSSPRISSPATSSPRTSSPATSSHKNDDIRSLEHELSTALGLKSRIALKTDQSGQVTIAFKTPEELDKLMNLIFGTL